MVHVCIVITLLVFVFGFNFRANYGLLLQSLSPNTSSAAESDYCTVPKLSSVVPSLEPLQYLHPTSDKWDISQIKLGHPSGTPFVPIWHMCRIMIESDPVYTVHYTHIICLMIMTKL